MEIMMDANRASPARPQAGRQANLREVRADESLAGQATEAVRTMAESAPELARDTYEAGARYVREGLDRYPEAGRYIREGSRAVSRPVEQNPLMAIFAAGALGYLLAYLIHGGGFQSIRDSVPDYARTRDDSRRSR